MRTMILRLFIILFCAGFSYACSDQEPKHQTEKYQGIYMDNSPRYGRLYKDPEGVMYNYRYMKATITNDSTIPLYVTLAFFENAYEPVPANGQQFNVFFLADNMTPENQDDDFYRTEVMPFLDEGLSVPVILYKAIAPKESCPVNIGFLCKTGIGMDPLPIILFSKGHRPHVHAIPDSAITGALKANSPIGLALGLDFSISAADTLKHYAIIPCGSMSFSKP